VAREHSRAAPFHPTAQACAVRTPALSRPEDPGRGRAKITTALATIAIAAALLVVARAAVDDPLPRATPESVALSTPRLRQATDLLNQFVADRKIAGAVAAVARRGKLVYLEAVGVQSLETRTPMDARSLFRIYSMTKSVTAVAVMILHEEGRFAMQDPVSKYLPQFRLVMVRDADGATRAPSREITIEDLLLHTSGLSHRTAELYRRAEVRSRSISLPQFVDNIVRAGLMEDPHTAFRYSEATTVLGRLVEIWSGKPVDAFFEERILRPLKMIDTGFWTRPDQRGRLTQVYATSANGLAPIEIETVPFTEKPTLLEGAVGLVSTAPDYLRFSQMLLNKGELDGVRLLKAATVERMIVNGLPDAITRTRNGVGWGLANVNVAVNGEYGWDGTAGTIFWIDPRTETITILMTQSSPANPDGLRQKFKALVAQAAAS
jgi:CubicO group peptidase (beta-lactamase class C family)